MDTTQGNLFDDNEYIGPAFKWRSNRFDVATEVWRIQNLPPPIPFDECLCENCGYRYKSKDQVRQVERDETCLYACTNCETIVDENPPPPF